MDISIPGSEGGALTPGHGGQADRGLIGFEFTDSIILHQFSLMEKLIKNSKPTQIYES